MHATATKAAFGPLSCLGILLAFAPSQLATSPASAETVRIYATNSGGDNVNIIDPTTHKTVGTLEGIEAAHGVAASPDGSRVYISNESESTLDVFDAKTNKLIKKVALSARPNNIAVAKDGRIVVAIARDPGALEIIDGNTLTSKVRIQTKGRLHNTYVTPDSKYAIMGSTATSMFTVVDLQKEEIAWELNIGKGVRPMTIEANPDGSTKRIFIQTSDLNGFVIVDFAERKVVGKIELPTLDMITTEKTIVGNLVGTYAELVELMALADRGLVDLHTKEYKLSQANDALHDLHHGRIHGRAVLIP